MLRILISIIVILINLSTSTIFAQLKGTVIDGSTNAPIRNARVCLNVTGNIAFTDAAGKYEVSLASVVYAVSQKLINNISINKNKISVTLRNDADVNIGLFSLDGKVLEVLSAGKYPKGTHSVVMDGTTGNIKILRVSIDNSIQSFFITSFSGNFQNAKVLPTAGDSNLEKTARTVAATDTLTVDKYGYKPEITTVSSNTMTIKLTPYKADSIIPPGMKRIVEGTFRMGTENCTGVTTPIHEVSVYSFFIDSTEVTQNDYYSFFKKSPWLKYTLNKIQPNPFYPAFNMSWYDAALYCNYRSKLHGLDTVYEYSSINGYPGEGCGLVQFNINYSKNGFRLPTEAEWEYAARAGSKTEYYWGNTVDSIAIQYEWYSANSNNTVHKIGSKIPNNFKLYDLLGNVSEFCNDYFGIAYYRVSPSINPLGPQTGSSRSIRGGDYLLDLSQIKTACRGDINISGYTEIPNGIRCVLPIR